MEKADEYRLRAAECLALALTMPGRSEKDQLRGMATIWESLAASAESSETVDALSNETLAPPISRSEAIRDGFSTTSG